MSIRFVACFTRPPMARLVRTLFWDRHTAHNAQPTATASWLAKAPKAVDGLGFKWDVGPKALLYFIGEASTKSKPHFYNISDGENSMAATIYRALRLPDRKQGLPTWVQEMFGLPAASLLKNARHLFDVKRRSSLAGQHRDQYSVAFGPDWENAIIEFWIDGRHAAGDALAELLIDLHAQYNCKRRIRTRPGGESLADATERLLAEAGRFCPIGRLGDRYRLETLPRTEIPPFYLSVRAAEHFRLRGKMLVNLGDYRLALEDHHNAALYWRAAWQQKQEVGILNEVLESANDCLTAGRPLNQVEPAQEIAGIVLGLGATLESCRLCRFLSELGVAVSECGYPRQGLKILLRARSLGDSLEHSGGLGCRSDLSRILSRLDRRIGEIIGKSKESDRGIRLLQRTVLACQDGEDRQGLGNTRNTFGDVYFAQHRYREALEHLEEFRSEILLGAAVTQGGWKSAHAVLSYQLYMNHRDSSVGILRRICQERSGAGICSPVGLDGKPCRLYRPDLVLSPDVQTSALQDRHLSFESLRRMMRLSRLAEECAKQSLR